MRVNNGFVAAALLILTITLAASALAQTPPGPGGGRRVGGFVPGQQRPPGDPAQIARGKTLYGISCTGCHGADLRGGDLGGPNLLRSQLALSDRDGELILPVIQGSRQATGMAPINMSPADGKAVAAYVRSVLETIGRQGVPPDTGRPAPSVLVGEASAGQQYFDGKCASCHSPTGDLRGIATRFPDPKVLQNTWVAGGARSGRGPAPPALGRRAVTVAVTPPGDSSIEGRLVRIDDFLVTLELADGTVRTFARNGDTPKVDVRDPMQAHRDLLAVYTDKDMHDVTAYLVTLK